MRTAFLVVLLAWPVLGWGKVLNVEFNFTPYTGDTKADEVQTVPGTAMVYDIDRAALDKVTDEDVQMCAGMVLGTIYQRLIAVHTPDGTWQVAP